MKRLFMLMFSAVMLISVTACGEKEPKDARLDKDFLNNPPAVPSKIPPGMSKKDYAEYLKQKDENFCNDMKFLGVEHERCPN